MASIVKHSGTSVAGVFALYWAFAGEFDQVDYNRRSGYVTPVLSQGKAWNGIYFTDETAQVESEEETTAGGTLYRYRIKLQIPRDRREVEETLRSMNGRRIVVMVTDKNGNTRVYGDKENAMKKQSRLVINAPSDGFNGYELELSGEFSRPAGFLLSDDYLPTPIPGMG